MSKTFVTFQLDHPVSVVVCGCSTVADPGFPQCGGANSPGGWAIHDFAKCSQKNCMKLKEFGPSLDPPMLTTVKIDTFHY